MIKFNLIFSILMISGLISCRKFEKCTNPGNLRCKKNVLQVCSGDENWRDQINCSNVNGHKLRCDPDEKTCVPCK